MLLQFPDFDNDFPPESTISIFNLSARILGFFAKKARGAERKTPVFLSFQRGVFAWRKLRDNRLMLPPAGNR